MGATFCSRRNPLLVEEEPVEEEPVEKEPAEEEPVEEEPVEDFFTLHSGLRRERRSLEPWGSTSMGSLCRAGKAQWSL